MYEVTGYDVYDRGKTFYVELPTPQPIDTLKDINAYELVIKANYNKDHNAHAKIYAIYRIKISDYNALKALNK